jgi:hypothetical protein
MNGDNMDNVRHQASRNLRTKEGEYLKDKNNELETYSETKKILEAYTETSNEFKKGYQCRNNFVKYENWYLE